MFMYTGRNDAPHPYVEKEFKYYRMASNAYFAGHKIKYRFYHALAKHYEKKYMKLFMKK